MNGPSAQAQAILRLNDRGDYTLPTNGLYPFQWNWDAGITALGWMTFDEPRAWAEYHALLRGQWCGRQHDGPQDGFIPHIVFQRPADSYFPGPEQWGFEKRSPPTSSISQPPLHGTMLRWMWGMAKDKRLAQTELRRIVPAIVRHNLWWYRARDPRQTGLVMTVHPWETGRDNAPSWDEALARVPRTRRAYQRKDLDHVDRSQRPSQDFYDRVVYLMDFMKEVRFDADTIAKECPFRVVDAAIVFILHRASQDLLALADELNIIIDDPGELRAHIARTRQAADRLWSQKQKLYVNLDLGTQALIEAPVHGGFLAWYAGLPAAAQATTLRAWLDEVRYGVPSTRATFEGFEAARYWRGPVWQHLNLLIAKGLGEQGQPALARRVDQAMLELFDVSGFREYYDPITGQGLGGGQFSWTAATWLFRQHQPSTIS